MAPVSPKWFFLKLPIGKGSRGVCPPRAIRCRIHSLCVILAATISFAQHSGDQDGFDHLGLYSLNLSDRPELRHLSAQGNQFRRLDVSGNPKLTRLLLFENPFDRPGIETLRAKRVLTASDVKFRRETRRPPSHHRLGGFRSHLAPIPLTGPGPSGLGKRKRETGLHAFESGPGEGS